MAFFQGLCLYAITLGIIALQNTVLRKHFRFSAQRMLVLANCQLILFLLIYHFLLAAHRAYEISWSTHTVLSLVTLTLYFGGLFVFHLTKKSPTKHATGALRFLLPFALPFLFFGIAIDIFSLIPNPWIQEVLTGQKNTTPLLILTVLLMTILLITMPFFMVKIWQCSPLPKGEIRERLEDVCKQANFKYKDLVDWHIMRHSLTAAIIGVIAPFRYILFTRALLERLPLAQIEAILAHEIGHSRYRHLLIYPFIIFGMMVLSGLFFLLFGPSLTHLFSLSYLENPSPFWKTLYPLSILLPTALIIAFYFRFVFGYFSRLFERQADLHPLELGIKAEDMIGALDSVAIYSGNSHKTPSWHHWSVEQRIDFLKQCQLNPQKIKKHHERVSRSIKGYFMLLLLAGSFLVLPSLPKEAPGYHLGQKILNLGKKIDHWFNQKRRRSFAKKLDAKYTLKGNSDIIHESIENALKRSEAQEIPGIAEFYGAQFLFQKGEIEASCQLMTAAWTHFDLLNNNKKTLENFLAVTSYILTAQAENSTKKTLTETMNRTLYQIQKKDN